MPSHPLTPAQALWQHYNITPQSNATAPARANPVQQKDLYARLHQVSKSTTVARLNSLVTAPVSTLSGNWQDTSTRMSADEGLGLSEM